MVEENKNMTSDNTEDSPWDSKRKLWKLQKPSLLTLEKVQNHGITKCTSMYLKGIEQGFIEQNL